jgi:group I intron endonuclease
LIKGIIYCATSPSGKKYIGQTVKSLSKRMEGHRTDAGRGKDYHFCRAIRKYGWDSFEWEVLYKDIPEDILDIAEMCAIYIYDTYDNGYNCTSGGNNTFRGIKWDEERRKRFSENHHKCWLGRKHTEETKVKMSLNNTRPALGKKYSSEEKKRISLRVKGEGNPMYGKEHTEKTKKRISDLVKQKYKNGYRHPCRLSHFQELKIKELREEGVSVIEIARQFKVVKQTVYNVLERLDK